MGGLSNYKDNELGCQLFPCLRFFPRGLKKQQPPLEILQFLAGYYIHLKRIELRFMASTEHEAEKVLLECIKGQVTKHQIFDFMDKNFDDLKKVKAMPCNLYLWSYFFCPGFCEQEDKTYKGVPFKISKITKFNTFPPRYRLDFEGKRKPLYVEIEGLLSFSKFQKEYIKVYDQYIDKPKDWAKTLEFLFSQVKCKNIPLSSKEEYDESDFIDELRYWVNTIQTEHTYEDLQNNKPILKDGHWYARGDAIYEKLRWKGCGRNKVFRILREIWGLKRKVIKVDGRAIKVWQFPKRLFPRG